MIFVPVTPYASPVVAGTSSRPRKSILVRTGILSALCFDVPVNSLLTIFTSLLTHLMPECPPRPKIIFCIFVAPRFETRFTLHCSVFLFRQGLVHSFSGVHLPFAGHFGLPLLFTHHIWATVRVLGIAWALQSFLMHSQDGLG